MQIRSLPRSLKKFVEDLVDWAVENGIGRILGIGGNSIEIKQDEDIPYTFYIKNQ